MEIFMAHHIMTGTHSPTHAPHLTGASLHKATGSHPSVSTFFGKSPSQSTGVQSIFYCTIHIRSGQHSKTNFLSTLFKRHYLHSIYYATFLRIWKLTNSDHHYSDQQYHTYNNDTIFPLNTNIILEICYNSLS